MSHLPFLFSRASSSVVAMLCRAQTYAHSGIEPSRLAKGFLPGVPKNRKNRIFDHLQTLRISATVKNRGIQAAYVPF